MNGLFTKRSVGLATICWALAVNCRARAGRCGAPLRRGDAADGVGGELECVDSDGTEQTCRDRRRQGEARTGMGFDEQGTGIDLQRDVMHRLCEAVGGSGLAARSRAAIRKGRALRSTVKAMGSNDERGLSGALSSRGRALTSGALIGGGKAARTADRYRNSSERRGVALRGQSPVARSVGIAVMGAAVSRPLPFLFLN